jgi:hypothetical protein
MDSKEPIPVATGDLHCPGPCHDCGAHVEDFVTLHIGREPMWLTFRTCSDCAAVRAAKFEAEEARQRGEREKRWHVICQAPNYRSTNIEDTRLHPECVRIAKAWHVNSTMGVGLISEKSGIGKTRCLFWALRRAFDAGRITQAVTHRELAKLATAAARGDTDEAGKKLSDFRTASVLLVDDVGKGAFTPRANEEFYDLVEYRQSHQLPILWSANAAGKWLIEKLGEDYGKTVVRRLTESCKVISL